MDPFGVGGLESWGGLILIQAISRADLHNKAPKDEFEDEFEQTSSKSLEVKQSLKRYLVNGSPCPIRIFISCPL